MDEVERRDLICRLFALITAKLEDAVGQAVEGQSAKIDVTAKAELADEMRSSAEELLVLAEATGALCDYGNDGA